MKFAILATMLTAASAFAPTASVSKSTSMRSTVEEVEAAPAFPTINVSVSYFSPLPSTYKTYV